VGLSYVWGILLILFGVSFLLNNLGISNIQIGAIIGTYWPLILIYFGLKPFFNEKERKNSSNLIFGVVIALIGVTVLGNNLNLFFFDLSLIFELGFALLLIFAGLRLLKVGKFKDSNWAIMSGIDKKNPGWKLEDESFVAIMGGIDLDLRQAEIIGDEIHLQLTAFMGGVDLKIPKKYNIEMSNISILGGMGFFSQDSGGIYVNRKYSHQGNEGEKTIYLETTCIMGGIDIK